MKTSKTESKRKSRSNRHGSLERRPNGTFLARWMANGQRYSQLIRDDDGNPITDKRTAAKLLEKLTAPYRLGIEAEVAAALAARAAGKQAEVQEWKDKQPALKLDDAFEAYRSSLSRPRGTADGTLDGYEAFYNALLDWLKNNRPSHTEIRDVTQADADAFAKHLLARVGAGTFNKYLIFLRRLWRILALDDKRKSDDAPAPADRKAKLNGNPWDDIQRQKAQPHTKRVLTMEQMAKVFTTADGDLRVLFAIGVYTGLRLGDCCLLKWSAIDWQQGIIYTTPHKTQKHGTQVKLPLHPALARILQTVAKDGDGDGYVLPELAAKYQRDKSAPSKLVQRVFTMCGFETTSPSERQGGKARSDIGFHSLRHTFVSMLGNAGASLALVQAMVGHTSATMTEHYFHANDAALRGSVNLLPDVIDIEAVEAPKTGAGARDGVDGADAPRSATDAAGGVLEAFRAIVRRMSDEERLAATDWLKEFNETNEGGAK